MNPAPAVPADVPESQAWPPVRTQAKIVALMVALSAMSYFDRIVMSIAGPGIMKDFHISETEMGSVYSAFLLTYTIMMTPGGALADRFGGRIVLTVSGLAAALFTGLTSLCGPAGLGAYLGVVPAFLVIRLAFGVCAAPIYPCTGRIAAAWIPPGAQARVQALIMGGASAGAAVSPVLFSWLIGAYGWRVSFWIAAAATVVLIAMWHTWVRDRPPGVAAAVRPASSQAHTAWRALLTDRNLLLLSGSYFALNYFEYIFYYWIYYYFGQIRHMGKDATAAATTAIFITMTIMTPMGGFVADWVIARWGRRRGARVVPIAGMALSAILLYIGASGLGVGATVAVLSLAVGCSMLPEGSFWSTGIHMGGKHLGAACGIMNGVGNVGGMLAPILTPLIATRFGWTGGLYFASAVVMLGMVAWFLIDPAHRVVTE